MLVAVGVALQQGAGTEGDRRPPRAVWAEELNPAAVPEYGSRAEEIVSNEPPADSRGAAPPGLIDRKALRGSPLRTAPYGDLASRLAPLRKGRGPRRYEPSERCTEQISAKSRIEMVRRGPTRESRMT